MCPLSCPYMVRSCPRCLLSGTPPFFNVVVYAETQPSSGAVVSVPDSVIVCVDLNKKLAFPLSTPPSAPPEDTASSTEGQPEQPHQTPEDEGPSPRGALRLLMHARSAGDRAMRGALYVCAELPMHAARTARHAVCGWVSSAGHSEVRSLGDQYSQNSIESHGNAVTTSSDLTVQVCIGLTIATCLLYTSPSPRDRTRSRMPSSA